MAGKSIYAGILQVQRDVKIPKTNDGGRFKYRSAEEILEKVKPVLHEAGLIVRFSEDIKTDAIGSYIESTCRVIDIATGDMEESHAIAREDVGTKIMSAGQATGAAISYARKYALCGMFAIDNEEDLDSPTYQNAIKNAQNAPQTAKNTSKDKSTTTATKTQNKVNDGVKAQAINKCLSEAKRLNLSQAIIGSIASKHYSANGWIDMTAEQITEMAENLESWSKEK